MLLAKMVRERFRRVSPWLLAVSLVSFYSMEKYDIGNINFSNRGIDDRRMIHDINNTHNCVLT
jgi:hypothetical protein